MNALPDIPRGLGDEILRKKYGKQHQKLTDLLLKRFSIETLLEHHSEAPDPIKRSLQRQLESVFAQINSISDYLRAWYTAYFNLCSKCQNCAFNQNGKYCSFYGEKKIPTPEPAHPNKVCSHHTPKRPTKKIFTNN